MMPSRIERGHGPAIIFANSAVSDYTLFEPQIAALADQFRAIGHNSRALTDRWQGPYTLWDLADDCRDVLDDLGVERAVIAGSSMGGYMALRFALRYPERTAGLVLLGSTAVPNTPEEEIQFLAKFEEMELEETIPRDWAEWCSTIVFSEQARREHPELVTPWIEKWTTSYPAEAIIEECRCWLNREDLTPRLGDIDAPTLIIHGEQDGAIPIERTAPMESQMPNARMLRLEGGHFISLESPDAVTDAIRAFLRDVYAQR